MKTSEPHPTDSELGSRVGKDDVEAFQLLYFRYADPLFRFLWRRTGERETAEDLVQELFSRVWKNRSRLDPNRSLKAYCYQTAGNLAIDHLRRKTSSPINELAELPNPAIQPDELAFERRTRINKALAALPDGQRRVFCLSRFEGLKYSEIAQTLEISIKTVENHMNRALKKLRLSLEDLITLLLLFFLVPL